MRDLSEVGLLCEVLTQQAVGVLVRRSFVGRVGMSEVDRHFETLTQSFMTGELFPVVDRECLAQLLRDAAKCSLFCCVESSTCAVLHLCGDEISALAFDTGHNHARIMASVSRAGPAFAGHFSWTGNLDRGSDMSAAVLAAGSPMLTNAQWSGS